MVKYLVLIFFVTLHLAAEQFVEIDTLMQHAIQEKVFPGAQVLISYHGEIVYHKAFGHYAYDKSSPAVTHDTMFDLASVTKLFTAVAVMLLCDAGKLSLDDYVISYLPKFGNNGKENIRIKNLLSHASGLQDDTCFRKEMSSSDCWQALLTTRAHYPAGLRHVYSDLNMIILQRIIEMIAAMPFDQFVYERITKPLDMHTTSFNPLDACRCAPAGNSTARPQSNIQGVVHDDQAHALGGVAGHAGLFSTAADLVKFMHALLYTSFVKQKTIIEWTREQAFGWGYGWEIGRHLSKNAFGHFGWTGTSIWADREHDVVCILLTNRTAQGSQEGNAEIRKVRVAFHELVVKLLGLAPYATPPVPAH